MKIFHSIFSVIQVLFFSPVLLWAQDNAMNGDRLGVEMADLMRSNGKIYVVVAVVLMVLTGLIIYIIRLDRKIRKMEKEKEERN